MKIKLLSAFAALAMVVALPAFASSPEIGKMAPEFTAVDSNGTTHNLSDFKGKTVVLEWSNHECPYVVKHYSVGNMQKIQAAATEKDVVWLTILSSAEGKQGNVSGEEANKIAMEQGSKATARLLDPSGEIGKLYNAKTTPHMFVIDEAGTLVYAGAIDSDKSFKPEAIDGATNYVMAALDSLEKNEPIEVANTKPYGCGVKY